jgi:hypothetical protein
VYHLSQRGCLFLRGRRAGQADKPVRGVMNRSHEIAAGVGMAAVVAAPAVLLLF